MFSMKAFLYDKRLGRIVLFREVVRDIRKLVRTTNRDKAGNYKTCNIDKLIIFGVSLLQSAVRFDAFWIQTLSKSGKGDVKTVTKYFKQF